MAFVQEQTTKITIKRLLLIKSRRYKDIWIRPYQMHVDHMDLEVIEDVAKTAAVTAQPNSIKAALTKTVPNILEPSRIPKFKSDIVNGWQTDRFIFVLEVEISRTGSRTKIINYIQGYTDTLGAIVRVGKTILDDNMLLIPNFVAVLHKRFDTPSNRYITTLNYSFNVEPDNIRNYALTRPGDIMTAVTNLKNNDSIPNTMFVPSINNRVVDKSHILPVDHIGSVLTNLVANTIDSEFKTDVDIFEDTTGSLTYSSLGTVELFKALRIATGKKDYRFTLDDLNIIDPNLSHKTTVVTTEDPVEIQQHELPSELLSIDTAETHDTSMETNIAYLTQEAISVILLRNLLSSICFHVTNINGRPEYTVMFATTDIEGLDPLLHAEAFMRELITKAWPSISHNNQILVEMLVYASLKADTTITVSVEGKPNVVYRFPTFADSLYLPVIDDEQGRNQLVDGYTELTDTVVGAVSDIAQAISVAKTNSYLR